MSNRVRCPSSVWGSGERGRLSKSAEIAAVSDLPAVGEHGLRPVHCHPCIRVERYREVVATGFCSLAVSSFLNASSLLLKRRCTFLN